MKYSTQHEEQLISKIGPWLQNAKTVNEMCDILNKEGPWPKVSDKWTVSNISQWITSRQETIIKKYPPLNFTQPPNSIFNHGMESDDQLIDWIKGHGKEFNRLAEIWLFNMGKRIEGGTLGRESQVEACLSSVEDVLTKPSVSLRRKFALIFYMFSDMTLLEEDKTGALNV